MAVISTPFIKKPNNPDIYDTQTGNKFENPQEFFDAASKFFKRPITKFENGAFKEVNDSQFNDLMNPETKP